jgi:hypothetical protein
MGLPGFAFAFLHFVTFVVKIRTPEVTGNPFDFKSARTDLAHFLKKDKKCESFL